MKLSDETIDNILHVIATFDRERGIPHDYHDLEVVLRSTSFRPDGKGGLEIHREETDPSINARIDTDLDDGIEGKEMMRKAAREWLE